MILRRRDVRREKMRGSMLVRLDSANDRARSSRSPNFVAQATGGLGRKRIHGGWGSAGVWIAATGIDKAGFATPSCNDGSLPQSLSLPARTPP